LFTWAIESTGIRVCPFSPLLCLKDLDCGSRLGYLLRLGQKCNDMLRLKRIVKQRMTNKSHPQSILSMSSNKNVNLEAREPKQLPGGSAQKQA
jgi:hypothetical protein